MESNRRKRIEAEIGERENSYRHDEQVEDEQDEQEEEEKKKKKMAKQTKRERQERDRAEGG